MRNIKPGERMLVEVLDPNFVATNIAESLQAKGAAPDVETFRYGNELKSGIVIDNDILQSLSKNVGWGKQFIVYYKHPPKVDEWVMLQPKGPMKAMRQSQATALARRLKKQAQEKMKLPALMQKSR